MVMFYQEELVCSGDNRNMCEYEHECAYVSE